MAIAGVLFCLCFVDAFSIETAASNSKDCLDDLNVGIAVLIDPSAYDNDANKQAMVELQERVKASEEMKKEESDLFMADVQVAMNVREEPSEESSKVGLLYKDCGGRILGTVGLVSNPATWVDGLVMIIWLSERKLKQWRMM